MNFYFWQKWLLFVGIYLVGFGLTLAFFNQTQLLDVIFNNQINPVFWKISGIPENTVPFQGWIYGVLGSTITGWGIFLTFLVHYPFKSKEIWAWNCIAVGISIWFVADTVISLKYLVNFNVVFNILLLLLIGIPLLFTRRYFLEKPIA